MIVRRTQIVLYGNCQSQRQLVLFEKLLEVTPPLPIANPRMPAYRCRRQHFVFLRE
jgi:hypothetical protein